MELSRDELNRYARHIILPDVGAAGQKKLKASSVLVVGAGGLGSPAALYLAAAGVGRIGLVDFDIVDESNLHRQILHATHDVGRPKLDSAREKLLAANPHVDVEVHNTRLTSENALTILGGYDVIVDGTDNFPTRYLVNDACVLLKKPNVYGSIFRFEGQVSVFDVQRGSCYRCLYSEPPPPGLVPNCADAGVLGILPGIIGSIQATEAIKVLLGLGNVLVDRLLLFDALAMQFREMKLRKNPSCPVCGEHPAITQLIDYEEFCGVAPVQRTSRTEISAEELKQRLDNGDRPFLLDVREPEERAIAHIGGTMIPLGALAGRLDELNKFAEIVVYCHHGIRSAHAVGLLRRAGFTNVMHLKGGIDEWSSAVDVTVPRY